MPDRFIDLMILALLCIGGVVGGSPLFVPFSIVGLCASSFVEDDRFASRQQQPASVETFWEFGTSALRAVCVCSGAFIVGHFIAASLDGPPEPR
jgi:hypothetical protein